MIEYAKYDKDFIHESSCVGVELNIIDYQGEREIIKLTDENCERFEEHVNRFYKIIYKPFRERFIVAQTVLWEPTIVRGNGQE